MAVHRGLLGIIKIKQNVNGNSNFETQVLCKEEERCEYFEIVWFEDRKHWFIVSLHEDGSLHLTQPEKISRSII
jgi:hypothetical protein